MLSKWSILSRSLSLIVPNPPKEYLSDTWHYTDQNYTIIFALKNKQTPFQTKIKVGELVRDTLDLKYMGCKSFFIASVKEKKKFPDTIFGLVDISFEYASIMMGIKVK